MKINVDVDCTAEETREFSACPMSSRCRKALMKEVEERLRANVKALDPETMLKTWLPAALKGFEQLQEMFLNQMAAASVARKK